MKDANYLLLTVKELQHAATVIIKATQATAFRSEIKSLSKTQESQDFQGKIHAKKYDFTAETRPVFRPRRGSWSYKTSRPKFPILLPRNSHITELLVQHYHEKRKNQGGTTTLNEIRLNGYWIISGTSSVSRHILRRVKCLQTSASATIHLLRRGLFRAMDVDVGGRGRESGRGRGPWTWVLVV